MIKVSSIAAALLDIAGFVDITPDEQPDFKPIISNHDNTSTTGATSQRIEEVILSSPPAGGEGGGGRGYYGGKIIDSPPLTLYSIFALIIIISYPIK